MIVRFTNKTVTSIISDLIPMYSKAQYVKKRSLDKVILSELILNSKHTWIKEAFFEFQNNRKQWFMTVSVLLLLNRKINFI